MNCAKFGWNKPGGSEEDFKKSKNRTYGSGWKDDMQTNGYGTTSDKKGLAFIFGELKKS